MEKFDVIVVGAGPAGLTAAYLLAKAGLEVAVIERGDFPGAKNVMGGVLYHWPLAEIIPEFWREAPLERHVIEQRAWILSADSAFRVGHRSLAFDGEPHNCYTVLRSRFDKWLAGKVRAAGALIIPETLVVGLLGRGDSVVGVRAGREDGEVYADVVITAEGANGLLVEEAGLRGPLKPQQMASAVKEIIALPQAAIENRFEVTGDQGVTIELFGDATMGMVGTAFIYTNRESVSVGAGATIRDLNDRGINPNDLLEHLKAHPTVAPLLEGGETREYLAHLIPEGGLRAMPRLSIGGLLVVGDAAMMVNSLHREGSNLAMHSGRLAAETVLRAKERRDFSARSLAHYDRLVRDSIIHHDLYKYRGMTRFFEGHHDFFSLYPDLLNYAATEMLTVDGTSKRRKQRAIFAEARRRRSLWRMAKDLFGAWRSVA
ncbi:MAG TPA: FAD-dependent oxidoreductase [Armatimonadota bacterium]|nr:FAD-dependent oxidoreductase [Armatimonadota bacterium]